jgi:uncharacterized protein involved in type VI secretion and phage assembly
MATETSKGNGETKPRQEPKPRDVAAAMFDWLEARGHDVMAVKMEAATFQKPSALLGPDGAPKTETGIGQAVSVLYGPPTRKPDEHKEKIARRRLEQMDAAPQAAEPTPEPSLISVPKIKLVKN